MPNFRDAMRKLRKWSEASGLENLHGIMDGSFPIHDAMGATLNLELLEVSEGWCVYEGTPLEMHLNPRSNVHGGWAMSILDAAAVLSVVTILPKGKLCATASIEVKFIRPLAPGQLCRAVGEFLIIEGKLGHARARLVDAKTDKLIASCNCSASIFDIAD